MAVEAGHPRRWRATWRRGLIALPVLLLLGLLLALALAVFQQTRPLPQAICCSTPADYGFSYEEVTFPSCDDAIFAGWYVPSQNGAAVILLHGYGATRAEVLEPAMALAEAGYGVFLYDLRGHGATEPTLRAYGWDDVGDVFNARDWLAKQEGVDEERIGIYGTSVGGQVAVRAAGYSTRFAAVAADNPVAATAGDLPAAENLADSIRYLARKAIFQGIGWRTGIVEPLAVRDIVMDVAPSPLLLITTGHEESTERQIAAGYFERAREPKQLWVIPEAAAGADLSNRPPEYGERLVAFFDAALGTREMQ